MADTFSPPKEPSANQSQKKTTPSIKRADFGDGYSQRSPDGLNYLKRAVTLVWTVMSAADCDTVEAFFGSHVAQVFAYTLPLESVPSMWTCSSWTRTYPGGASSALSADLVQEFDLA